MRGSEGCTGRTWRGSEKTNNLSVFSDGGFDRARRQTVEATHRRETRIGERDAPASLGKIDFEPCEN